MVRGADGGHLVRIDEEGKIGAVGGTKGFRWLEAETIREKHMEDKIDMVYFRGLVDDTYAHIASYGDADWFVNG